jgi:nucleoid-associated protein YgaU
VDSRPGAAPPGEGWFRVRVGLPVEELERPAGRDPVEQAPVEQAPVELDPSVDGISAALPGEALPADVVPPAASQTSILVRRDTTLWSVAREHYGRTDAALIDALARYNRLLSPNHLELGQRLWLPSLEELLGSE